MGSFHPYPPASTISPAGGRARSVPGQDARITAAGAPESLSLVHPGFAVRDIALMRSRFGALGFRMTPISFHEFGICTTQVVFRNCLIELQSVYDEANLDQVPAGGFRLGRWLQSMIAERDGVAFIALYSADAADDARTLRTRGLSIDGRMEYGRYAMLPDVTPIRTRTTTFVAHDPALPRLTTLLIQQHQRGAIEMPRWLHHPNTARGISQITILAARAMQPAVREHYATIYGTPAISRYGTGFAVETGAGLIVVMDHAMAEFAYGRLPPALAAEMRPVCIATHVLVDSAHAVLGHARRAGFPAEATCGRVVIRDAAAFGNAFLVFDSPSYG